MGVPGFFMWLWKKYKGDNFVFDRKNLKKNDPLVKKLKKIDYFLLDTNCLIHPVCFKILAENNELKDKEKLENKMMNAVLEYLEKMIKYIDPKIGVYIAIDGVAPIAKIKQQRSRRFKSVHDKILWDNIKKKYNKDIPNYWNNSAITPGTEFMQKLNYKILDWCRNQKLKIIYSSSNTPSEGEHKLLQFIRDNKKEKKEYSYVIYGLDADLIFLGLATGLKDVYLLREAVHLNRNKQTDVLNYVSMEKMRESIITTVEDLLEDKKFINEDNIINDFIFICYFLGNDFLPHLASLDIHKNGLDYLMDIYVDNLKKNNYNYLINKNDKNNIINQKVFDSLVKRLSEDEDNLLVLNYSSKRRRRMKQTDDPYEKEMSRIENLAFKIDDPIMLGNGKSKDWEKRYFKHYFEVDKDREEFESNMCRHYLTGLKWVTLYYFDECPSWNWYFPYDHPPFLKGLYKNVKKYKFNKIKLNMGRPLKPFEQLLSVLPPQSSFLLPNKLQNLMTHKKSSLIHLYPISFEQDFIGKHRYWMGIPNLPNLEIELVKKLFKKYKKVLNEKEKLRNIKIKNYEFNF